MAFNTKPIIRGDKSSESKESYDQNNDHHVHFHPLVGKRFDPSQSLQFAKYARGFDNAFNSSGGKTNVTIEK